MNSKQTTTGTMSRKEIVKKVVQYGPWVEDILNDHVMDTIAASVAKETGKKRKLKLSRAGLKLIQSRFFQESKSVSYSLSEVKTVTRLLNAPTCVMFVLEDKVKRFRILAFRCTTEEDAVHIISLFDLIQLEQPTIVELKKEDNGNWTLRERNAHVVNKHMADIFNERSQNNGEVKPNGSVTHISVSDQARVIVAPRPEPVHVVSVEKPRSKRYSFKRNKGSKKSQSSDESDYKIVKNKGDEYVIETEVSQVPYVSMKTHSVLGSDIDVVHEHPVEIRVKNGHHHENHTEGDHLIYSQPHAPAPTQPLIYKTHTYPEPPPVVYRSTSRTYDTNPRPVSHYADPWAAHRRFVGEFDGRPRSVIYHPSGYGSDHGSVIMRADTESVHSKMSRRSRALSKSEMSVKTTVQRPIEATYGRRSGVVRHVQPAFMLVPIHRNSYHDVIL